MKDFKTHFIYWILPTAFTLIFILLYFFDPFGMSSLVSPEVNREFGLLETLQLVLIVIVMVMALRKVNNSRDKYEKYLFAFVAFMSLFFFLEEMDYGLHYYEYFLGVSHDSTIRNVHNNGKITSWFKMGAYIFLVLFFVIFPFTAKFTKNRSPFLYYITPSGRIISTLISLVILNQLAFYFYNQDVHTNRSLDANVSEFEELMIYYIVVLYMMEMTSNRKRFPYTATSYQAK